MGFSVLRTFKNILFGSGEKKGKQQRKQTNKKSSSGQRSSGRSSYDSSPPAKKKIFTKDEGEYVDYEEVK